MRIEFHLDQDETMPHINLKIIPTLEERQEERQIDYIICEGCKQLRHTTMFVSTYCDPLGQQCLLCGVTTLQRELEKIHLERRKEDV